MVAAEKGESSEGRAGKRSRGASPNGNNYSDSSDEEREGGGGMRVGRDYQAQVPPIVPAPERKVDQYADRALLVWSPTEKLTDAELEQYVTHSKEKYGYNAEQALGMLFWHKHDMEKALCDLSNFTPFPDEWSIEDKVLFEQAFQFHGKSFHRIRQMLPDKSIAALVRYYYSWKKTRMKSSLMDRQVRRVTTQKSEDGATEGVEIGPAAMSDSEAEDKSEAKDSESSKNTCLNCGFNCTNLQTTTKGPLCTTCANHLKKTGTMRPTTGPVRRDKQGALTSQGRSKRKPPRGMYLDHDDLVTFATKTDAQCDALFKGMDSEIITLKRTVQSNKQVLGQLKKRSSEGLTAVKLPDTAGRINSRWTPEELLLGVQGIRKYGKDFKAIAEVIGTKTANHVRVFFVSYRTRYNLDAVLKEYEAENGPSPPDDKMEAESSVSDVAQPSGNNAPVSAAGSSPAKKAGSPAK